MTMIHKEIGPHNQLSFHPTILRGTEVLRKIKVICLPQAYWIPIQMHVLQLMIATFILPPLPLPYQIQFGYSIYDSWLLSGIRNGGVCGCYVDTCLQFELMCLPLKVQQSPTPTPGISREIWILNYKTSCSWSCHEQHKPHTAVSCLTFSWSMDNSHGQHSR